MRTPANRLWLFSALVAVASGTASLTFDASAFSGGFPATSIFDVYYFPLPGNRSFTWTSTVPVTIQNVCLGNDASHQIIGQENIVWGDGARSSKTRRDEFQAAPEIQLNSEYDVVTRATCFTGELMLDICYSIPNNNNQRFGRHLPKRFEGIEHQIRTNSAYIPNPMGRD